MSLVGTKYVLTFHLVTNNDGPPWTFSYVVDSVDFSQGFTYEAGFVNSVVTHTFKSSPTTAYFVDAVAPGGPAAVNPDPNQKNGMVVVANFYYTNGTAPAPTAANIGTMLTAALAAAGV